MVGVKAANYTAYKELKDSCAVRKGFILNITSKKANVIIHGWDKPHDLNPDPDFV